MLVGLGMLFQQNTSCWAHNNASNHQSPLKKIVKTTQNICATINAVRFHNKKLKGAHSQAMCLTKD